MRHAHILGMLIIRSIRSYNYRFYTPFIHCLHQSLKELFIMRYSKKKSFALLNTLLWIALRLLRNPILNRIRFFYIAFKRLYRILK